MKNRQKTKKQHFLPQKSLSRFASKPGKIFVFDKQTDRSFENAINKTACQEYFYDMKTVDHDPQIPERFQISERAFTEVEAQGQPVIEAILSAAEVFRLRKTPKRLSDKRLIYKQDRIRLAFFLAVQYLRTPDQRESLINLARVSLRVLANLQMERAGIELQNEDDFDVQLSRECQAGQHVLMTLTAGFEAAPEIAKHIWLFSTSANRELVTCDTPVILLPHESSSLISGEGLLSPGIQIICNLSPTVTLSLFERKYFSSLQKVDGYCTHLSLDGADYLNRLQLKHSRRYLYSRGNDFDWARNLLATNPAWRNPVKRVVDAIGPLTEGISDLFDNTKKPQYVLFLGREEHSDQIDWEKSG